MKQQNSNVLMTAFINLTILFFMWGFMTALNDILIPYLQGAFELTHTKAMLVQFAFFTSYFVGSLVLSFITLLCNGPLGDILILLASPIMLRQANR